MNDFKFSSIFALLAITLSVGIPCTSPAATLGFNDFVNPVFYVADNSPQDANPLAGVITYSGPIGVNWSVNVTTGTSKPLLGSADAPQLDLNSVSVSSSGGGRLLFGLVDSGFSGLGSVNFDAGGTTSGSIAFDAFVDDSNTELFFGSIFASLGPFSPNAFSSTVTGSFVATAPYALGILADITHAGGGTTSFDAALSALSVPEPMSLLLLGLGLMGLVGVRRFKK